MNEYKKLKEADDQSKPDIRTAYDEALATCVAELGNKISRLAEESAMLWWVVNEYSTSLKRPTSELSAQEYAFVAAAEAAERTTLLPPPPSANSLLGRAIKPCKRGTKKSLTLAELLGATEPSWRAQQSKSTDSASCADLVPVFTAIGKCQEFGNVEAAAQVVPNLCPGIGAGLSLSAREAAEQYYAELMFLRALAELDKR